jgi:hypothetical protein
MVTVCYWLSLRKTIKNADTVLGLRVVNISTRDISIMKNECYPLDHDAP